MCAFALALVTGLMADAPLTVILFRAVMSMTCCYFLGVVLGWVAERCIAEASRSLAVTAIPEQSAPVAPAPSQPAPSTAA